MADNYEGEGKVVLHTADGAITAGDVVELGDSIGIALVDIADTEDGAVAIVGRWTVAKATGTAWNQGDKLDWDTSASNFGKGITEATGDISDCAIAAQDAASGDATAEIILTNPGAVN